MDAPARSAVVPARLGGRRWDAVLADLAGISRARAKRLLETGEAAAVGGGPLRPAGRAAAGTEVHYRLEESPAVRPAAMDLSAPYEDGHLAVVDKPAGMVVHPAPGHWDDRTLVSALLHRWPQVEGVGSGPRWGIVHRLDKDTSGVMAVALTEPAFRGLSEAVAARGLERKYLALVHGSFSVPTGTIDAPLGRRRSRRRVSASGKPAVTHYRRLAEWSRPDLSLLEITLETGRTHQIRAHLESIGHHAAGDPVYGRPAPPGADPGRVWLHSRSLAFQHPITGQPVRAQAPLPPDLENSLQALGAPRAGSLDFLYEDPCGAGGGRPA